MIRELTFMRTYPAFHPKKFEPTYFVEKVLKSLKSQQIKISHYKKKLSLSFLESMCHLDQFDPKNTSIRNGKHYKVGDIIKPMVWAGKPYHKTPEGLWKIQFAPEIELKKVWDFEIQTKPQEDLSGFADILLEGKKITSEKLSEIALNDGVDYGDLLSWFKYPKAFSGQIICWNNNIEY